jgi:hypothetical protein
MPLLLTLLVLVSAALLPATPAAAGNGFGYSLEHRPDVVFPGKRVHRSPYPMSRQAASVWHSDFCFKDCTGQSAWRFEACIASAHPEDCRVQLDAADRMCLRTCRPRGGPLLNIAD